MVVFLHIVYKCYFLQPALQPTHGCPYLTKSANGKLLCTYESTLGYYIIEQLAHGRRFAVCPRLAHREGAPTHHRPPLQPRRHTTPRPSHTGRLADEAAGELVEVVV